jgi:flavin reductase (DIM6/NTAB) family NADH-FMN oxidoreductase RutF
MLFHEIKHRKALYMINRDGKVFYDEVEMMVNQETVAEMTKMPRIACATVIRDKDTGYINAGIYSGGIISVDPFQVIFGIKAWDSKVAFEKIDEFVIGLPAKHQFWDMWIFANDIPHGISEIDVAGLTECEIPGCDTPGVREFPINLRCKVNRFFKLGGAMRNIVVADVTGISMDLDLIKKTRAEAVSTAPLHEAIQRHKYTGFYAVSVMADDLLDGDWDPEDPAPNYEVEDGKVFIEADQFKDAKNKRILANAMFDRPNYILNTADKSGEHDAIAITGGLIMHSRPAIQAIVPKGSKAYQNIKDSGEFSLGLPLRPLLDKYKKLQANPGSLEAAGFTPIKSGSVAPNSVKDCHVNIECTLILLEDIPGSEYALAVAHKQGASMDPDIGEDGKFTELYGDLIYTIYDYDLNERFSHPDSDFIPVPVLPTWGSRYNGGWWGGPEGWQSGFQFWLIELLESGYLSETEYHQLKKWISWWRSEGYPAPEPLRTDIRARLTKILSMMTRAHRSFDKWKEIHEFFDEFADEYDGPWRC